MLWHVTQGLEAILVPKILVNELAVFFNFIIGFKKTLSKSEKFETLTYSYNIQSYVLNIVMD